MRADWDPDRYERFRAERQQPFADLLGLVRRRSGMRVVDLGCGTGELTRLLHDRLLARETIGIDTSEAMLARSAVYSGGGVQFRRQSIDEFNDEDPFDLIISNAALHWVPGHGMLLRRLTAALAPGGQLAVQVPANNDHPAHVAVAQVAGEEPFRSALGGYVRAHHVLPPEAYAQTLSDLGYREQHVRLQVYGHVLAACDAVVEWMQGTTLVQYRQRLSADLYARFVQRCEARLRACLPDAAPYFYTFKRILLWGRR